MRGVFVQIHGPFQQNSGLSNKLVAFSNKILDMFDNWWFFMVKSVPI